MRDRPIELTGYYSWKKYPEVFRRIEVWDEERGLAFVLVSNHFSFGATTIARIYKDRWQVEISLKTIKQGLKIKTFVSTSPNALMTQIWTALITMLVLKYLKFRSRLGSSLSSLIVLFRYNFLTCRDLWEWLENRFEPPPIVPEGEQLLLNFG